MNFAFSEEERRFRSEVREFLSDYRDLDGFFLQGHKWEQVKALFRALGERGWLSLTWPKEWGGQDLGPTHEYILWDEVAYARAARNPLSAGIVANTLLRTLDDAIQMHGGLGYSQDKPFGTWYRFCRSARLADGPDEVHRMVVARDFLMGRLDLLV